MVLARWMKGKICNCDLLINLKLGIKLWRSAKSTKLKSLLMHLAGLWSLLILWLMDAEF